MVSNSTSQRALPARRRPVALLNVIVAMAIGFSVALSGVSQAGATSLDGIDAISAQGDRSCALTNGGGVMCWGNAPIGNGRFANSSVPDTVVGLDSSVKTIAAGSIFACAINASAAVECWGMNEWGELGIGTSDGPEECGSRACATKPQDVTGLPAGIVAVSAGAFHTCALTSDSRVKCWGSNDDHQLGDGTTTTGPEECGEHSRPCSTVPIEVADLDMGIAAVEAGGSHTCVLTTTGGVKCWGSNRAGRLGDGESCGTRFCANPVDVTGLGGAVEAISSGGSHTCVVTKEGGVKCWGANDFGQLGDGSRTNRTTPVNVLGLTSGVDSLSSGDGHTCAVMQTGGLKCWGRNLFGNLGIGYSAGPEFCHLGTPCSTVPLDVIGLDDGMKSVEAGGNHTCAMTSRGTVLCWGHGRHGQLGNGTLGTERCYFESCSTRPLEIVAQRKDGYPGDANCDGYTDSVDSALILQLSAHLVQSLPCLTEADINGDGLVNSLDAVLVLQCAAFLVPCETVPNLNS